VLIALACLGCLTIATPHRAAAQDSSPEAPSPLPEGRVPPRAEPRSTPAAAAAAQAGRARAAKASTSPSGTVQSIKVEGNQRIEQGTILSYILLQPGDRFDADRIDRSVKTLYATGLFQDVNLVRDGDTLVVRVTENPIVNQIAFEGNHKLTEEQLRGDLQLRPRAVFTPALAQADRQRILDQYAHKGRFDARVEPKIIRLPQNRVNVVFEIAEGDTTLTSRIAFVGNKAVDEETLREVINSREQAWFRFLSSSDEYDPDRVAFDRELLRRYYLKHGYADIQVTGATAELAPDRSAFFLTFTLNEGERYKVGSIEVNSQLRKLDGKDLLPAVQLEEGDWYDGDAVDRSIDTITNAVQNRGYAFVEVKPRISRDTEKHTVALVFDVGEGPRVYVERIDIQGNTVTEDKVIRREFRFAEGDAFNSAAAKRTRQRLQDLGYFSTATLTNSAGSAPDKAVVTANVEEKPTGELSLGGGYSTDAGALADVGLRQKNLLGTGIDASINGVLAQYRSSVDLSVTDPYFLDRNLVAGADVFFVDTSNQLTALYDERRYGFALRTGYEFNEHLRQSLNYTLSDRDVYNVSTDASFYIYNQAGYTLLSQVGQTFTIDYRDSVTAAHDGFVIRLGSDYAGLGGDENFVRTKVDGSYYIPLDRFTGNSDWTIALSAGTGYLFNLGRQEQIIDRFFLGGDNLRGFQSGGAGPHDPATGDSLGGRFIYTQSSELRFPLPVSPDLGLSGRTFVDIGGLTEASFESGKCNLPATYLAIYNTAPNNYNIKAGQCPPITNSSALRLGAGVGISWNSPFGLINIDLTPFVLSQQHDQKQIFRFGFGTRF
jgi:outer membrane protein insertion porin family